jgi:hypothetical protein
VVLLPSRWLLLRPNPILLHPGNLDETRKITVPNKSDSHLLYVLWSEERHKLVDLIMAETQLIDLRLLPNVNNLYIIRTTSKLDDWVHSKSFPCSTHFMKALCKINQKIQLSNSSFSLSDGVIALKRWDSTDFVEITFFNGYWLANALMNRLRVEDRYRMVNCLVSGSKNAMKEKMQQKRTEILKNFSSYQTKLSSYSNYHTSGNPQNKNSTIPASMPTDIVKPSLKNDADHSTTNSSKNAKQNSEKEISAHSEVPPITGKPNDIIFTLLQDKITTLENRSALDQAKIIALETKISDLTNVLNLVCSSLDELDPHLLEFSTRLSILERTQHQICNLFTQIDPTLNFYQNTPNNEVHEQTEVDTEETEAEINHRSPQEQDPLHETNSHIEVLKTTVQPSTHSLASKTAATSKTAELSDFIWFHLLEHNLFT